MKSEISFGDEVSVDLSRSHGTPVTKSYVIGEMRYSTPDQRVWLVATDQAHGMPVGPLALAVLSRDHQEKCRTLRARYESLYPRQLRALP